ncbi:MAG: hypothetical protein HY235_03855 [Acidobacteria bacterium]|nr:hypothetical protein [Acidobacteriota bacterium]
MSSIRNTLRLWTAMRREKVLILAPGEKGLPELISDSTPMMRACYLSPDGIDQHLEAGVDLDVLNSSLLLRTGDSEALPTVTALLFSNNGEEDIAFNLDGHAKKVRARLYLAATASGSVWGWHSDLVQGKLGYFVTGMLNQRNLWRIRRVETDFANRLNFAIQPLVLPNGLPSLDLTAVQDQMVRQEVEQHWREFTEVSLRGLPYRTVNAAKDLCECLLLNSLVSAGHVQIGNRSFKDLLDKLQEVIRKEQGTTTKSIPYTELHYHLMSKLRILHGRTHVGRVATSGRLTPDLALTAAQDLIEVLRAASLIGSSS